MYFIINNSSLQCLCTFTCVLVFYTTNEKQQQQIKIDIIKTNKRSNRNYIYLAVLLYFVWFAFILIPLRQTNLNFKYIKMLLINQVVANSIRCMPLWCWIIKPSIVVAWFTRSLKSNYLFFSLAPQWWRLPSIRLLANSTVWSIHWHILISIFFIIFFPTLNPSLCVLSYVTITMANDCSQPRNSILPMDYFFLMLYINFSMEIVDRVKKTDFKIFLMVTFLKGLVKQFYFFTLVEKRHDVWPNKNYIKS